MTADTALLLRQPSRKLAVANAHGQAFHEFRHRVLAIGADQFGQRREQACLREAVAVDALVPRFRPGFVQVAQRRLLLFVVGQRVAGGGKDAGRLMNSTKSARVPGRNAS